MLRYKLSLILTALCLSISHAPEAKAADYMPILSKHVALYGLKPGMMLSEAKSLIESQGGTFLRTTPLGKPLSKIVQSSQGPYFTYFARFGKKSEGGGRGRGRGRGNAPKQTTHPTYIQISLHVYPTVIGSMDDPNTLKIHSVIAHHKTRLNTAEEKNGVLPIKVTYPQALDLFTEKFGKINAFSHAGQDRITISLSNNNGLPHVSHSDILQHRSAHAPKMPSNACYHMAKTSGSLQRSGTPVPNAGTPIMDEARFKNLITSYKNDATIYDQWQKCGDVILFQLDSDPGREMVHGLTQTFTGAKYLQEAYQNFDASWRMR